MVFNEWVNKIPTPIHVSTVLVSEKNHWNKLFEAMHFKQFSLNNYCSKVSNKILFKNPVSELLIWDVDGLGICIVWGSLPCFCIEISDNVPKYTLFWSPLLFVFPVKVFGNLLLVMQISLFICCQQLLIGHAVFAVNVLCPMCITKQFINIEIRLPFVCPLNTFIDAFL